MKSSIKNNAFWRWALVLCVTAWIAGMAFAQTKTEVRSGEVVYVSGNQLVVKMADGQLKTFNVPEGAHFTVDGQDVSVHELKPGTHLTQTIETTETPKTVTTVRTVHGKVWAVNPPYVIVTLADGTNKQYKVPEGTKFNVDGQEKTVFDLRKGMNLTATITKTESTVDVARSNRVTGQAPPPPPATPPMVGVLLVEEAPTPSTAQAQTPAPEAPPATAERQEQPMPEQKPAKLPKTGSSGPALGLIGALSLSAGLLLRAGRRLWFG